MTPLEPRRAQLDDVELAYLETGPSDGPLVLCQHGFPDVAPTFTALLDALAARGFRAVAPWQRGYAPSGLPADGNAQVGAVARDLLALAEQLAPGAPVDIVGHDWGALAGYDAAGSAPERVRRLVAMAVPHPATLALAMVTDVAQLKRAWYQFYFTTPLADAGLPHDDFALVEQLWRDWSPRLTPDPEHLGLVKQALREPERTRAALGTYRHLLGALPGRDDLVAVEAAGFGPIPVPTLYLHGTSDGVLGVELVDEDALRPLFPAGLQVEVLDGPGHFLHLEEPERVARLVVGFLS